MEEGLVIRVVTVIRDITDSKKAKKALEEEKSRLQSILNSIEYGLSIQDRNYNVLFQNMHHIKLRKPAQGEKCYKVYEYSDSVCDGCPVKMAFEDGRTHISERIVKEPSGEQAFFDITASPIIDSDGNITSCMEIVRNVTDRKRVESALADSEAKYRTVVESSLVGVYIIQDGLFRFVNQRWCDIYGYSREEAVDRLDPVDLTPEEDRDRVRENIRKRISGEVKTLEYDIRAIRKSGDIIHIRILGSTMTYRGRPAISGTIIDITEQVRMEETLRAGEAKMRSIVENIGIGVALISPDMKILEMNQRLREWTSETDYGGHACYHIIIDPACQGACQDCPVIKTFADGHVHESDIQKNQDGSVRTLRIRSSPVHNAKGEITAVIELIDDITERISLESQLQQSRKMESIGRLAGGVAHDFNNMLSVIMGYSDLALLQVDERQPLHSRRRDIYNAAARSSEIVKQLLAFARKQTISPRTLDLNRTIEDLLKILHKLIGEDIEISWNPGAGTGPVLMDPAQVEQITINLCVNARDAIRGTGRITIETAEAIFDENYYGSHPYIIPGNYTMLSVSDNGSGMDQETLNNIFEPFYTTKDSGRGTGLGLATIYGIVKQNNGFINVYSEPGRGSTFKIFLPRHEGKNTGSEKDEEADIPRGNGETILVVDDESAVLELVRQMLESQGYKVLPAGSPAEAIELAKNAAEDLDLLMSDVILPEMNGKDLVAEIESLVPGLRSLYISGYTGDVITNRGMLEEGAHFIQKPFSMKSLAFSVREALDSQPIK
jgi:PAS domain S-box-containing protein